MTELAAKAIEAKKNFVLELSSEEYADLIVALNYAWENVRAEDEAFHDNFSAERLDRVKWVRENVCNRFTVKVV